MSSLKLDNEHSPTIHVYYCSRVQEPTLVNHLLYGMEEEGVPYVLKLHDAESALALGYRAAGSSNLGVGIGISESGHGVVHYNKLPYEKPLFEFKLQSSEGLLRTLGANAARIVKNIPFKEVCHSEEPSDEEVRVLSKEEIAFIVQAVVQKLTNLK